MGRFDYPSPYWDSVGDPALDLIDRMLTVDVEKRITIDECLEHPWVTQKVLGVSDSTDGLTGAMSDLDFSKRKVQRERTLLAHFNSVKVSKVIEWEDKKADVKVFEKNPDGKRVHNHQPSQASQAQQVATNGLKKGAGEKVPAAEARTDVFMGIGGKGDPELFDGDGVSRYEPDEVPS